MTTPFETLIQRFFRRIEKDREFFNYLNMSDDDAMSLAIERARGLLFEAIELINLKAVPSVDFNDYDESLQCFNFELTNNEIMLISSFMYQQYLERDIAKLKCLSVNYTSSNLKVFDPSNARSTFESLYNNVCDKNEILLDEYNSKDRENNQLLSIDYSKYGDV